MRIEIKYLDTRTLDSDRINTIDENLENFFGQYGLKVDFRYYEILSNVRTLGFVDDISRHVSMEFH